CRSFLCCYCCCLLCLLSRAYSTAPGPSVFPYTTLFRSLLHPRHLGLDLVLAVGLLDVETDLECATRITAACGRRLEKAAEQLGEHFGERVVYGKSGHRLAPVLVWLRRNAGSGSASTSGRNRDFQEAGCTDARPESDRSIVCRLADRLRRARSSPRFPARRRCTWSPPRVAPPCAATGARR